MTDPSETSLRDDLSAAFAGDNPAPPSPETPPSESDTPETLGAPPPIPAELPPLEAPQVWGKQYKDIFQKVAQTPEQRAYAEAWLNQWKETQGYITKRDQEFADYRKSADPLRELIKPYEGYWQQQGMSPVQGMGQLIGYAEALAKDPRGMIPQLARMYGVDLTELVSEQPYVDPQVAELQAQVRALQGQGQQWQQQQQQQQYSRLAEEVQSFETATDENGNPKHPHFARVFDRMVGLAKGGLAQSIQDAYDMAVSLDKELQSELSAQKAQAEAVARAAEAKKALDASRTVKSKAPTAGDPPEKSLRDDIAAQLAAAGYS